MGYDALRRKNYCIQARRFVGSLDKLLVAGSLWEKFKRELTEHGGNIFSAADAGSGNDRPHRPP
jgi:hypothetical protein